MQTDWPYPQVDWSCQAGINGDTAVAEECGLAKADLLRVLGLKLCDQPGITCGDHGSGIGAIMGPFGAMALGGGHGDELLGGESDAGGGVDAKMPVGRRGSPLKVPRGANEPDVINGRSYGGHALDEMQSEGFTPNVVDDAIEHGKITVGNSGHIGY